MVVLDTLEDEEDEEDEEGEEEEEEEEGEGDLEEMIIREREEEFLEEDDGSRCRCAKYFQLKLRCSYRLLNASLDAIVKSLKAKAKGTSSAELTYLFPNTSKWVIANYGRSLLDSLTNKLWYPYEYIDCPEKLTRRDPPEPHHFHSLINDSDALDDDNYAKFLRLWKDLRCENLGDMAKAYQARSLSFYLS